MDVEEQLIAVMKIPAAAVTTLPSPSQAQQSQLSPQLKLGSHSKSPASMSTSTRSPVAVGLISPNENESEVDLTQKKLVDELEHELGIIDRSRGPRRSIKYTRQDQNHNESAIPLKPIRTDHHVNFASDLGDGNGQDETSLAEAGRSRLRSMSMSRSGPSCDDSILENQNQPCSSLFRRPYPNIKFFLFAFILGFILALFGVIVAFHSHTEEYGFYYAIGSVISAAGTIFLAPPGKQLENLHLTFPAITAVVIFLAFLCSYVCVLNLNYPDGAVMLFCVQYMALSCYSIYYIPSVLTTINNVWRAFETSN